MGLYARSDRDVGPEDDPIDARDRRSSEPVGHGLTITKDRYRGVTEWWGERDGKQVTYDFPTRAMLMAAIDGGYAEVRDGHRLSTSHVNLGTRPIRGFSTPMRGTTARCSCGEWKERVNEAPSAGGERVLFEWWIEQHIAPMATREEA